MYELIAKNKRKSVLVMIVMAILMLALGAGIGIMVDGNYDSYYYPFPCAGAYIGMLVALLLWGVQALVAYKRGAQVVLSGMDARLLTKQDDPMMYNIIEELSMASGLPMPKIYLINTSAMNAFASGTKPESSVVAITAGLRNTLNRQEIQGVMAHEMSHIYNRDVMYMTFASVMMCTIVILSDFVTRIYFYGGGRSRSSNSNSGDSRSRLVMMVIILLMALVAGFVAQLFYFSLSRKREYLADTMAVKFTQDPSALADALQKISGDNHVFNPGKMAAAMCISKPKIKEHATDLYSTHPPIQKRIAILRAMSEGTSYENYCRAYEEVMGKRDLPGMKK